MAFFIIALALYLGGQCYADWREKVGLARELGGLVSKGIGNKIKYSVRGFGGYVQDKSRQVTRWAKDPFKWKKKRSEIKAQQASDLGELGKRALSSKELSDYEQFVINFAERDLGRKLNEKEKIQLISEYTKKYKYNQ